MTDNDTPIDLEDVPPEEDIDPADAADRLDQDPEEVPNRAEVEEPVSLAEAQTPEDR